MKEGYEYPECALPYNEASFVAQVKILEEERTWRRLSEAAQSLARKLSWQNALQPLLDLLGKRARPCH
jgi:hypothetical protein